MKYVTIICALIVIVSAVFFIKNKQKVNNKKSMLSSNNTKQEPLIKIEQLPETIDLNEKELTEITDSNLLSRIDSLLPELFQVGTAAKTVAQAQGDVLYQAIIPAGEKLAKSKNIEGAVRGFYHGSNGIKGHADFLEVNQKTTIISNKLSATMGVASMVVGQYYMTQINAELSEINKGINQIADFQNKEYKSKVFALLTQIKKTASFKVEILENEESRILELNKLNNLEQECIELLGQANMNLDDYTKIKDLNYEKYEKEVNKAHNWYVYQQILLDVLYKISDLKYTLHLGKVSREQCVELLATYIKQVEDIQGKLSTWNKDNVKHFRIDTSEIRRKREGIDAAVHFIPGIFNDNFRYRSISKDTANMITMQSIVSNSLYKPYTTDFYNEDVRLISKGGKIYYLPYDKNSDIK